MTADPKARVKPYPAHIVKRIALRAVQLDMTPESDTERARALLKVLTRDDIRQMAQCLDFAVSDTRRFNRLATRKRKAKHLERRLSP